MKYLGVYNRNEYFVQTGDRVKLPQGWRTPQGELVCYKPVYDRRQRQYIGEWEFNAPEEEHPPFLLDTSGRASAVGAETVDIELLKEAVGKGEDVCFEQYYRPYFTDIVSQGPHNPDYEADGGVTVVINRKSKFFKEAVHYLSLL